MKIPSKTILQDDTIILPPDPPNGVKGGVSVGVCDTGGICGFSGVSGSSGVLSGSTQSGFRILLRFLPRLYSSSFYWLKPLRHVPMKIFPC